jgi:uncharacterized Rmd1/YagE family protein
LAKRIAPIGEILLFDYGVAVFWGFTSDEERLLLDQLSVFEEERLEVDDVETEQFFYQYLLGMLTM